MHVLRNWGIGVAAAIALCAIPTVAIGDPPPPPSFPECTKKPTPADVEGAKGAHKAASQFYERGEYDKAVRYWNDAYVFDCTANDLLLNIANAFEKLGDKASTVATLETYLKRTGPNPNLELRVKNLKQALAAASVTAPPPPPPPPPPTATTVPTQVPAKPRPYGNTPWFVVGGGGVFALVGLILLPIGFSAIADVAAQCPNHRCPPGPDANDLVDKGNAGRIKAGVGWGFLTVGVLAAGGGLAWQLLYNKPQASRARPAKTGLWLAPMAGPDTGGLAVGGTF